jgi:hypothetical protein
VNISCVWLLEFWLHLIDKFGQVQFKTDDLKGVSLHFVLFVSSYTIMALRAETDLPSRCCQQALVSSMTGRGL